MDRVLYLASAAGRQVMAAQAINANNLANASTVGFRQDFAFADTLALYGPGHPSRVYSQTEGLGSDHSAGPLMTTGRDLDVAIRGEGWFAVQGVDGEEGYTRAGDLRVNATGLLTTAAGHPVVGNNGGPITLPPFDKIEIGGDGTITVLPQGQAASTLVVIDRLKLVKPPADNLAKGDDGLFRTRDGESAIADGAVRLVSGTLESSNVNAVEAMVNMMELARKFELQIKVIEDARSNDNASARLLRLN